MEGIDFNVQPNGSIGDPNDRCIPRFFYQPKHMVAKSNEAGRPIFEQEAFVEIIVPGDSKQRVVRKVMDMDKSRWPMQWFKFEKMGETKVEGTPIEQWPVLNVMQVAMLKSLDILSIEALANLEDRHLSKLGPDGRLLRQRAQIFLKQAADNALVEKQAARIDELEAKLKQLLEASASKPLDMPETPKKRGRPPKVKP